MAHKTAGQLVSRAKSIVAPEKDNRLMARLRSDRITSSPEQLYAEEHRKEDIRLRDAPAPPAGYRYTMDGRLIPIEGTELPITDAEAQELFCDVIEITGSLRAACDALGIRSIPKVKGYMMRDPDFAEMFEAASERHRDGLLAHAVQRATKGVQNPIFSKDGERIGYETKYSDGLLKMLLERYIPEFRRQPAGSTTTVNISGDAVIDARSMTREQRDAARTLLKDKSELPEIDVEST